MKKLIVSVVAVFSAVVAGCGSGGGGGKGHFGASTGAAVGTTVVAGSLVDARSQHTATALADGARVLIAGGETLRGTPTDTLELWEAGRSQPLFEQLRTARAGHVAALLADGRVWIAGGRDVTGKALRSTELWDPVARTVTPGPDLAAPRDRAALLVGVGVFAISGGGAPSVEFWRDDLSGTATVGGLPVRFGGGIASLHTDTVVIAGGVDAQGQPVAPVRVQAEVVTRLPGERFVEGGLPIDACLDGQTRGCFIVGGRFGPDDKHSAAIQDVSSTDTEPTFARQKLLVARERHTVVELARGFLVAGGLLFGRAQGQVELINAEGSSFAASLSAPRYDLVATVLPGFGGAVLFTGGLGDDGRQVGLTELLLPPGAGSLDGSALFARARDEEATRLRLVAERDFALAEAARLTTELQATQQELTAERALRAQREQELAAARARAASLEASLASTQAQLAAARSDVAQRQASLDQQTTRVAQLEAALAGAQQAASAQQARADQLQGQLAAAQAAAARAQATRTTISATATTPAFQIGAVTGLPR